MTDKSSKDLSVFSWLNDSSASQVDGPLMGRRLGVKDLFDIAGIPTGAGNPDWLASHAIPESTSVVVAELIEAGAVLTGKTQTDELAYSLNGQNVHYGTPINPAAPNRLPGGSSSGSAVAVAAGLIDIGLGTDTGGSIRVPASYNGLFGIRTSHGLVSTENMVPLAPLFDTVGWLCRDAALLYQVGQVLLPNTKDLGNQSVRAKVLQPKLAGEPLWQPLHQQWLVQQDQINCVANIALEADWLAAASDCFRTLQGRNIWQTHGAWIKQHKPLFAADVQQRFGWASELSSSQQAQAEQQRVTLQQQIQSWFDETDVLIMPTTPGPSPMLDASAEFMDHYRSQLMGLTAIAGLAGLPQVHLPVLTLEGAPAGISILGRSGTDLALLRLVQQWCAESSSSPSFTFKNNTIPTPTNNNKRRQA